MKSPESLERPEGIAVIGMSGRFPGAKNVEEFWQNLRNGVESISFFSDEELLATGIDPAALADPNYVKAGGVLEDAEWFDASFFGFTPREAELMDPQHRLFLECAWEALEQAGYDAEQYQGAIGVYAGAGMNSYLVNNLIPNPELVGPVFSLPVVVGNDKDHVSTRVSYKLNLRGPSFTVQTACSTSLVAIHLACQSLLNGECDLVLAGGVSVLVPQKAGYFYHEGGIYSPDGHCRAFDHRAQGTVGGRGVGVVVLKRLAEALAEGDCVYAIIRGSAINNDGALKVGYTAPSVDGQAAVITEALTVAGVEPETVSLIEAHGTGTPLGDPIEVAALTQAFRARTDKKDFCAIGSVKTNLGHLDVAAGVTGLIKTVLALRHKELPPSLHFARPNPKINFAGSPFYVNTALSEWKTRETPRRAGVSSFGIGGTNAHVIVEEAPPREAAGKSRPFHLLVLSAKTSTALEVATTNLADRLTGHPDLNLADVAHTLQVGRKKFRHRRMLVCQRLDETVAALRTRDPKRVVTDSQEATDRPVVFMFPGQGAQYVRMGLELYRSEPVFRQQVDACAELLKPHLGLDLREVLYPHEEKTEAATYQLTQTGVTQPALFVIEYALARLWMSWGVRPQAMIGHSIGEYVAACLAGVFSLEDALALVAVRARLMQQLPGGAMLAVPLPAQEVEALLGEHLAVAAINEPSLCVVSGPTDKVERLEARLAEKNVTSHRLHTSHAYHSPMMDPILEPLTSQASKIAFHPPQIPYISGLTGTWITATEATGASYWARHLRQTVRFAAGVQQLLREPDCILLEVGPGRTLSTAAGRHPAKTNGQVIISSLRHPYDRQSDIAFLLQTLGRLWLSGVRVEWVGFYAHEQRQRLPLPTYPFERQRYWIEPQKQLPLRAASHRSAHKKLDIADWFYLPSWKRCDLLVSAASTGLMEPKLRWLIFADPCGISAKLVERLEQMGHTVFAVSAGGRFARPAERASTIDPRNPEAYKVLIQDLCARDKMPDRIVHLWGVTPNEEGRSENEVLGKGLDQGFYSLLFLTQALVHQNVTQPIHLTVVTGHMQDVTGEEALCPEKAMLLGPCKVVPQESPNITCQSIDLVIPASRVFRDRDIDQLLMDLATQSSDRVIAYRGGHRWVQTFEPVRPERRDGPPARLREGGVYLITGGLGGVGLVLAECLAQTVRAKLILTGRTGLPAEEDWEQWLHAHDPQDEVSQKIRKVQALGKLGAEVLIVRADVAHLEQMQKVITLAYERFGTLHGVIHAAGILDEKAFREVGEITQTECERHFQPKVRGLPVLQQVLQDRPLDFCLLVSSLSSVLGGLGFVAYAAANLFMDTFAQKHNRAAATPWISVNWDGWQLGEEKERTTAWGATLREFAITPAEGVEAFQRVLSMGSVSQVIISTGDLSARIDQWMQLPSLQETSHLRASEAASHARPALLAPYVAPRNEVERAVARIWQALFGIEQVGVEDNFFELGGHSLLAVQLLSRLRDTFHVKLAVSTLFDAPTVTELAQHIEKARRPADREAEKIAELLQLVEQLDEDEVKKLLAE